MADNNSQSPNEPIVTNSFGKGLIKDYNDTFVGEGFYTHARNSVNNSHDGQLGVIGNEPANLHCFTLPYDLIGSIHMYDDKWVLFTTDDVNSEIGVFDESLCSYTKVVNAACLGFKKSHLITGVYRFRYDCEDLIYWEDGLNPGRTMDISNPQQYFFYTETIVNGCVTRIYTTQLNCETLRIAPLLQHPCLKLQKGNIAGTLPNGSYQACIAYTVNQVKVSDYIGDTQVQGLFTHLNVGSSLEITIDKIDKTFDEFELVVISTINAQTVCKRIGYYSTSVGKIYVDKWDNEFISVSIGDVVLRTETVEKSDAMYSVNNYLLRLGTYGRFKFNYQKQANKITTKWVAVQYPADYYRKGGNHTSYLRDEQYPFFIRWIYNTGERSESYHIPGRAATASDNQLVFGFDAFETLSGVQMKKWQVENTATVDSLVTSTLIDGGVVIASGKMAYWESLESYPANKLDVWGNLCGKPIRHHKMPDITVNPVLNHFNSDGANIVVLGVQFDGIEHPLDLNGLPITNIVGYEILRGSREGNKSIIAKGLFNNMRKYPVPENGSITGLYQNYPYNDLGEDGYLTSDYKDSENAGNSDSVGSATLKEYAKDIFSFHSPEVTFSNPYLNGYEVKLYQEMTGTSRGSFKVPFQHPKFKQITNGLDTALTIFADIISVATLLAASLGGGMSLDLSSNKDLPILNIGTPIVVAEGTLGAISDVAGPVAIATNITLSVAYAAFFQSTIIKEQLLSIVLALIPYRQYAAQYDSYGFYNKTVPNILDNRRRKLIDSNYIGSSLQQFTSKYQINNINRSKFVTVQIEGIINNTSTTDNSRFVMDNNYNIGQSIDKTIASYYGAYKIAIPGQYGQLDSIKQLIISDCIMPSSYGQGGTVSSSILFGGDIYINRFTEKNSMLFFNTWLLSEPNGFEFDYLAYGSLPYPRYWINTQKHNQITFDRASDYRRLDGVQNSGFLFRYLTRGFFYLFNSGVRDFFVESEINLAYRDWDEEISKRYYDPYNFTDLNSMFRSDVIKSGEYYKYDYNLSVSKLFNSSITWGDMLPRDYNPITADSCYTYRPYKIIYSLPQQDESKKDSWRTFLANNYYDFLSPVTTIKSINKTGAIFLMKYQSPMSFMGVEELKLDGTNTKITIGDGGLFTNDKQLQSIVNVDESYEYGSSQSKYGAVGTKFGVFWISQNQGKVFNYSGQLDEISANGLRYWFAKYLPSELLKLYSDYALYDNPVKGIGVQMIYDNTNDMIYITKKDYKPLLTTMTHDKDGNFYVKGSKVEFTNTTYFEDASWTISYDPKNKVWVSFHDWIPTFLLPGKNHFMSVNKKSIWKHNIRCDKYCNYYGVDYPWEIEFVSATGQQVTTTRSVEYLLEAYKYYNDCRDKFHILDENFDKAIIYNSEQVSGLLDLVIKKKNDPLALLAYPIINPASITINFSKEENKYRFNQFWDITNNRGEFTPGNVPMFKTYAKGYYYEINSAYVNYSKDPLEHKKFRHNVNRVWLRKTVSGDVKFLFKLSNQKIQPSYR